ncbi:Lrp/AsnC family transcriptional regulator [Mesorhizobium sp. NZP2234]|uniref:Lrp/AsnC family transcriptional regulator n=1 Tax=Mesorhizobium sp. NZP2234 TaxID=2483402 RepID=UPI001AED425A|nr:Lrp/AsnC family transcriptional regulator [Mesorhizobium sp. NZP2234]
MTILDAIDRKILRELRADARVSTVDLAARVGLSPTPCARRVKRLEDGGVIQGYAARINPSAMGLAICVIVSVRLGKQGPEGAGEFLREVAKRPEITECLLGPGTSTTCCVSGSRTWPRSATSSATSCSRSRR